MNISVKEKHPLPLILLFLIVLPLLLASVNFSSGIAEDPDAYGIVYHAMNFSQNRYIPSRSWGFPMYEIVIYPLIYYGSIFYAQIYSLIFYLLATLIFFFILCQFTEKKVIAFIGTLCFTFLPVSIISGNTVMETSQGIFLALTGLYFSIKYHKKGVPFYAYSAAIFFGLATSTRPDYVIISFSAAVSLFVLYPFDKKTFAFSSVLYFLLSAIPFLIYGTDISFRKDVIIDDPIMRKCIRAFMGYLSLFGLFLLSALTVLVIFNIKKILSHLKLIFSDYMLVLSIISFFLYTLRFIMLPDELEYVYILVPLLIIIIVKTIRSEVVLITLCLLIALPNIMQIHLFERDDNHDIKVSIGFSPGSVYQDRRMRLLNEYTRNELPELFNKTAQKYGRNSYVDDISMNKGDLVIIPEERLRYYKAERLKGKYHKVFESLSIITYPLPSNRGWRQFLKFKDWKKITPDDFTHVTEIPE